MTTENLIVNKDAYQQYYNKFQFINDNNHLTSSPINYQSDGSSVNYTDLSSSPRMETSSPSTASISSVTSCHPCLRVLEEPKDQLRFRYKSEKGFHGGLKPVIKLDNCKSYNVWIQATLFTCGHHPILHVFELDGKQCENGACWQKVSKDFTAKFPSLSICMKKKDEIPALLRERIKQEYKEQKKRINADDIQKEVDKIMSSVNFNAAQLRFEAFYDKMEMEPVCEFPVFSKPIYNQKCTLGGGELKITRLSMCSGKASGNEDMILLCDKVRKDDIEIVFYCEDLGWEEKASFNPGDVHHQVAIPFKTPRFIQNIEEEVHIRLQRKSDGKCGEPRVFIYKVCEDFEGIPSKRKRQNSSVDTSILDIQWGSNAMYDPNIDFNAPEITESFFKELLANMDTDLPFDEVEPVESEGIPNLASLNLSEKKPVKKRRECRYDSDIRPIQILKNGIISLLKEREYATFISFLPALLSMRDENGNSLLHLTVTEKSDNLPLLIKMVELAPKGVINQTNKAKMTPLHLAVCKGLWKVVRVLIMMGADPNIRDRIGNTCTHLAAMYSLPWCLAEVLAPLLLGEKKKRRFYSPAINTLNYEGLAPLHLSVKNDSKICVKLLLQAKAEINIPDGKCGKTPLHLAYEKNSDLISLLQSQPGVNHNAEDFNGSLPNSCISRASRNSSYIPRPTECCIELSTESSNSNEDECVGFKEEKSNILKKADVKKEQDGDGDLFCEILNSNGLWKKLGLYIKEEKELNVIGVMDTNPTETILNELKKLHGEKYSEKLKFILSDDELKEYAYLLKVQL